MRPRSETTRCRPLGPLVLWVLWSPGSFGPLILWRGTQCDPGTPSRQQHLPWAGCSMCPRHHSRPSHDLPQDVLPTCQRATWHQNPELSKPPGAPQASASSCGPGWGACELPSSPAPHRTARRARAGKPYPLLPPCWDQRNPSSHRTPA